ncbi:hypothetical protein GCM10011529_10190 [Polymorphobacter glacialis]|uniref:Peptidase C14 caspase domain-containing protein n=1 Tax=Sandarakinorhabdus glacialis TaxID=1614636 RepID=A0A916ZN45_9SPHN|nr:caspase family protein [Polymorphobacter glacialis]GGE05766.1 hypothetical protein GCM10011529_10190 [Polymorphobacter glacialis]
MADPALILDRRAALLGNPGLHAVLIGVSDYTFLPAADDPPGTGLLALRQLKSSALTAMALSAKLQRLDTDKRLMRPLATIRLLVAPSPEEIAVDPALAAPGLVAPTIRNIELALLNWRIDVATQAENQALFLFSGHGVRRSLEESILLAQDFLEQPFAEMSRSFRLSNIRNGMAPSAKRPDIGREQFFFVDACRDKPEALDGIDPIDPPAIFTADLNIYDDRKAPIFFATTTGGVAAGEAGKPTYFGLALLWALENGSFGKQSVAGIKGSVWPVNASSLKAGIEVADALFDARVELTGLVSNPVLCFRRDAPEMTLKVWLEPADYKGHVGGVSMTEINTNKVTPVPGIGEMQLSIPITAGQYRMTVQPSSNRFAQASSEVTYFSIQMPMPWTFDLASVP